MKPGGTLVATLGDGRYSRRVRLSTMLDGALPRREQTRMRQRLRRMLARHWQWWRRAGGLRGVLGPIAAKKEVNDEARHWAEERSRFWAELREGQREAEAQRARLLP